MASAVVGAPTHVRACAVRMLRHGSAIEVFPMFGNSPILQPFWAAGFAFSRGHFIMNVPYDCCLPMMFQGEEIDIVRPGDQEHRT